MCVAHERNNRIELEWISNDQLSEAESDTKEKQEIGQDDYIDEVDIEEGEIEEDIFLIETILIDQQNVSL